MSSNRKKAFQKIGEAAMMAQAPHAPVSLVHRGLFLYSAFSESPIKAGLVNCKVHAKYKSTWQGNTKPCIVSSYSSELISASNLAKAKVINLTEVITG
jgi:hypothetical protein